MLGRAAPKGSLSLSRSGRSAVHVSVIGRAPRIGHELDEQKHEQKRTVLIALTWRCAPKAFVRCCSSSSSSSSSSCPKTVPSVIREKPRRESDPFDAHAPQDDERGCHSE